ncbi:MAG: hypothetical protein PHV74_00190 [Dehalococcoidia bacterium]|nr:hypothetical protein [Dehalococcoidia bacterium]
MKYSIKTKGGTYTVVGIGVKFTTQPVEVSLAPAAAKRLSQNQNLVMTPVADGESAEKIEGTPDTSEPKSKKK